MRWLQFIGAGTIGYFALIGFFILQDLRAEISFFLLILMWTTYVVLLIGFIFLFLFAREKYLGWKAERLEKQKQAEVQVVIARPDEQVHIRDTNHKAMWRNATTDPRIYANGHLTEPTQMELEQWRIARAKNVIPGNSTPLLPTGMNFYSLLDHKKYPHLLLVGGTGNGKTTLLRLIADVRKKEQHKVLILDSRSHPDLWSGFDRMNTEEKIDNAIRCLFKILRTNIKALREGRATEVDFDNNKMTIITDEWGRIVKDSNLAKDFIEQMVKESRKYGIYLIFATQTNQASELGLDGRYKTMNGFLQLELQNGTKGRFVKVQKGHDKLGEFDVPEIILHEPEPTGFIPPSLDEIEPDPIELEMARVYRETNSLRKVGELVLGIPPDKYGSQHSASIKDSLRKLGFAV